MAILFEFGLTLHGYNDNCMHDYVGKSSLLCFVCKLCYNSESITAFCFFREHVGHDAL